MSFSTRQAALVAALAVVGGAGTAGTASADIVVAPTGGAKSRITLSAKTTKALKRHHVSVTAIKPAAKTGSALSLPYSLARWDFAARSGDVAFFTANTGLKLRSGRRSIALTHLRLLMDSRDRGYITGLISNVRIKTFTVSARSAKVTDSATTQQISSLQLKLTQAGADYVNRALHQKALARYSQFATLELNLVKPTTAPSSSTVPVSSAPGQGTTPGATLSFGKAFTDSLGGASIVPSAPGVSVDTNGDGQPDVGVLALPLKSATFDVTSGTGTIKLGGGLAIGVPGSGTEVALVDPEIQLGTTAATSGLFATINGVRVKVGDIDPSTLHTSVANGTVNITGLNATVSTAAAPMLNTLLGTTGITSGGQLASLDLSIPQS